MNFTGGKVRRGHPQTMGKTGVTQSFLFVEDFRVSTPLSLVRPLLLRPSLSVEQSTIKTYNLNHVENGVK